MMMNGLLTIIILLSTTLTIVTGELFTIANVTVIGSEGIDDVLSMSIGSQDEIYLAGWTHGEVFEDMDVPFGAYGYTGTFLWTRSHPNHVLYPSPSSSNGSTANAKRPLSSANGRMIAMIPGDYSGRVALSRSTAASAPAGAGASGNGSSPSSSNGNGVMTLALVTTDTSLAPYVTTATITPFEVRTTALSSSSTGASTSASSPAGSVRQDIRRLTQRSLQSNPQQRLQSGLDIAIDPNDGSYWMVGSERSGSQSFTSVAKMPTNNATTANGTTTSSGSSGTSTNTVSSTATTDFALWHFSSQGKLLHSFTMGNLSNNEVANRIVIDKQSNLYVIGSTQSKYLFGNKRVSGVQDGFLAKYSSITGDLLFATLIDGGVGGWDDAKAIYIDDQTNSLYVAGCTASSAVSGSSSSDLDVFVGKFSTVSGERQFLITFAGDKGEGTTSGLPSGNGNECASDITRYTDGDLLVTGYTTSRSIKGIVTSKGALSSTSSTTSTLPSDNTADAFIAKLSSQDGTFGGIQFFGKPQVNDYGNAIVVTSEGDVILAGTTYDQSNSFYGLNLVERKDLFPVPSAVPPAPVAGPSAAPVSSPSQAPSRSLTSNVFLLDLTNSLVPTASPTIRPTQKPTLLMPTRVPTTRPSSNRPVISPTRVPTMTRRPTQSPSEKPSFKPSRTPTNPPTNRPIGRPTMGPTRVPTIPPTRKPTNAPSLPPWVTRSTKPPTRRPTTRIAKLSEAEVEMDEVHTDVDLTSTNIDLQEIHADSTDLHEAATTTATATAAVMEEVMLPHGRTVDVDIDRMHLFASSHGSLIAMTSQIPMKPEDLSISVKEQHRLHEVEMMMNMMKVMDDMNEVV